MKVCLISRFFDLRNAGIGRYSENLFEGLKKRGCSVDRVSQDGGIPFGEGRAKYLLYTALEMPFKMPADYDIYHACSPIEAIWISKKRNSVVTFHDLIPMLYADLIKANFKDSIMRFIGVQHFNFGCRRAINCNAVIADSKQTAQDLISYLNVEEDRISVVRPGIPPNLKPNKKKNDIYTIGTLSFLEARKRIDILIKAFIDADLENAELIIAGRGFEEQKLKKVSKGDERIKFLGFIPDSKLCDFYNSLDVFVFPSLLEGYGLPIVEAMACGKPVITLEDAIIPEDIKSRTFIVELSNLTKILKNQEFECDIIKNLKFAKEHSWDRLVKKMFEIYNNVIG